MILNDLIDFEDVHDASADGRDEKHKQDSLKDLRNVRKAARKVFQVNWQESLQNGLVLFRRDNANVVSLNAENNVA